MQKKRANWFLWLGFLTTLVAFVSYFLFFLQFPVTLLSLMLAGLLIVTAGFIAWIAVFSSTQKTAASHLAAADSRFLTQSVQRTRFGRGRSFGGTAAL